MRLAFVTLLPVLTGCVALAARLQGPSGSSPNEGVHYAQVGGSIHRVGPYWGPACVRIEAPSNHRASDGDAEPTLGKQPNLAHDPADQILRLICVERIMADHDEPGRNTWVTQHFRFDELFFDHLTASMMLVQCLAAESCLDAPHVPRSRAHQEQLRDAHVERGELAAARTDVWQLYQAGMMRWYADRVDPAEVGRRLAALPLDGAAQHAYLELLGHARAGVIAMTSTLSAEARALFVDLPIEIFERRAAEHARSAKVVRELAVLIDRIQAERAAGTQAVSDDTVARLTKLRLAYHASCKQDCTRSTIFAAITQQLFWSHVSRGDAAAATVETRLLSAEQAPSAAQEIALRQSTALGEAITRRERVESARRQGVDADAARSAAAGSVLDFGDGRYVYRWERAFEVAWQALIPGAAVEVKGKVAGVDRRGAHARVRFQDTVRTWVDDDHDSCVETNRVDRVRNDGTVVYRERCSRTITRVDRTKTPPVVMAAGEAAGLVAGDELIAFATAGPPGAKEPRSGGRVWLVKRGGRVVRLRDLAL
ncbi:MAG: hypothetical protein M3680_22900 [Myxococcota bacterium]|nr:hypothetical protein [Myxococcota bacterium]